MNRNKTARQHNFAIVPSAEIPRSKFPMRQTRKQAFDASELIPIYCEEVLPGDTWSHRESVLARLATPIAPLIDDMDLETFYFYVPNRITWNYWEDFITGTNTNVTIPTMQPTAAGIAQVVPGGVLDHFGLLPGNYTADAFRINALPIFAYFKIFNDWFRDQNIQSEWEWTEDWGTGNSADINLDGAPWQQQPVRANKRSDYFTRSLPWPQKGAAVQLPIGGTAPVLPVNDLGFPASPTFLENGTLNSGPLMIDAAGVNPNVRAQMAAASGANVLRWNSSGLYTDLAAATMATINSIRLAFQTQKLLERDARGGSRYNEQLLAHFGVIASDARLQRPEYLGGSRIPITINPIAQTAAYSTEPSAAESALGNLGAEMHASGSKHSFTYSAEEHGYIIGLAVVRATPTYQQGTRRHWKRLSRLDYYFPVFSHLGEQAVHTSEIFQTGTNLYDNQTWGYQERYAELRYTPNEITGVLRSTALQPLDWWHLSEEFANEPALNVSFIEDKTQEILARCLATAPSEQWSAQIIMDILHQAEVARLMPTYSDPGLIDHF